MNLFSKGKRDQNETSILQYLRARNIKVTQLTPGDGADLILWVGPMIVVEVKNPSQPPSKQALTECEKDTLEACNHVGIPYHVVKSVEDMAAIIDDYMSRQ